MKTKTAPYTAFGKTKQVPIVVYRNNKIEKDVCFWDDELWIERSEDWYALMSYPKSSFIRIIERNIWIKCKEV